MTWRDRFRPQIAKCIELHEGDTAATKRALRETGKHAYQCSHTAKIWRSEVKRQLGIRSKCDKAAPLFDTGEQS